MALCGVLLEELESLPRYTLLKNRLINASFHLLDDITLAIQGRNRFESLTDADCDLRLLRAYMALGFELGLLTEMSYLEFSQQADLIGRQIGGWLKKQKEI